MTILGTFFLCLRAHLRSGCVFTCSEHRSISLNRGLQIMFLACFLSHPTVTLLQLSLFSISRPRFCLPCTSQTHEIALPHSAFFLIPSPNHPPPAFAGFLPHACGCLPFASPTVMEQACKSCSYLVFQATACFTIIRRAFAEESENVNNPLHGLHCLARSRDHFVSAALHSLILSPLPTPEIVTKNRNMS